MPYAYDLALVALSLGIAILGSFTGLVMTAGIQRVSGLEGAIRIVLGATAFTSGIWSMHFVAILAAIPPVEPRLDAIGILLSTGAAATVATAAFAIVGRKAFGPFSLPLGAAILGIAMWALLYFSAGSPLPSPAVRSSWTLCAISLLIAMQASGLTLWFAFHERGVFDSFLGAIALGLVMASMYYASMETTDFSSANHQGRGMASSYSLAMATAIATYGLCALCIFIFTAMASRRRGKRYHRHRYAGGSPFPFR